MMTKRITVAALLPSGVVPGDFSLAGGEGGEFLKLTVTWPNTVVDLVLLHRKWLRVML